MKTECDLPAEYLVAYQDGYLTGARREVVEAHLQTCRSCQLRLAAFREVDGLLRAGTPLGDSAAGRAAVKERLAKKAARRSLLSRGLLPYVPLAATLIVVLVVLTAWPTGLKAAVSLGEFVQNGLARIERAPEQEWQRLNRPAPSEESRIRFQAVAPERLPGGLALVERSAPDPDRLELSYRSPSGTAILLREGSARSDEVTSEHGWDTVLAVRGTGVGMHTDHQTHAVTGWAWERAGVVFELRLVAPRGGGWSQPDAIAVIEAIMAAQDGAPVEDR